ncbi:MAG: RNB domain-containing ribonuclease [Lentisphaeria bacterium]|nr:RNB domain-containing ribonuclease [Lentisphaeria bacterium]
MSRRSSKKKKQKRFVEQCTGTFSASRNGFGFVETELGEVFIPAKFVNGAINGDTVTVTIVSRDNPLGAEGKIERIEERSLKMFVGMVVDTYTVKPLDSSLPVIKISGGLKGAKKNDWVRVRLLDNGAKFTEKLRGSVEERIGKSATLAGDLLSVSKEFNLPEPYSDATELFASKITPLELDRKDLTKEFTVTIDPEDAKDFDDAISIREEKEYWYIGVHIADVAAWVRPGTKLDQSAFERGFSSYIPTMFRPMLPGTLTKKISLRQGADSPAHTVILKVEKSSGRVVGSNRFHSLVKVDSRLDYDGVQFFLEKGKTPEKWGVRLKKNLSMLAEAVRKMREYRAETEQFLSIETAETKVICDEAAGKVIGLEQRVQRESEAMVEECMLAANSAVAVEMIEKGIPGLYRVHGDPEPGKLEEFAVFAEGILKRRTGDLSSRKVLCRFLENLPDDHTKYVITSALLRAMQRACYEEDPAIHFGLGKTRYSHFTSPIRRYADLFTHQQLLMFDLKKKMLSKKKAAGIAEVLLKLEKRNDDAYFAAVDRLKLHFLKQFIQEKTGTLFEGAVVKINAQGMICDIPQYGIRGFVPTHRFTTIMHRRPPKPGNLIYLYLDSLDFNAGTAFFRPV